MRKIAKRRWALLLAMSGLLWWWFCLPSPLFDAPLATVVFDRQGNLLSARIAEDGQWRMPVGDSLSAPLAAAVVLYEDRRFYDHWGVDFRALARALRQNWRAGRVVSGGSTLSMQVMRMARGRRSRNLWNKGIEALMAWRLELRYDKQDILRLWLAHAPFGGNVVGMEAAAWRYFGRPPHDLSWAEAATLAVLPNSPALIHPGRNREKLKRKRDQLIDGLLAAGRLDTSAAQLAKLEPLPAQPLPLPDRAPHLLQRLYRDEGPGRYHSSIDGLLQDRMRDMLLLHHQRLAGNQIHNLAMQVTDVATGQTLVYLGNVPHLEAQHQPDVDMIDAPRSPGSLLKPMLYGLALQDGMLTPRQWLRDVPVTYQHFSPANFHEDYDGIVAADQALVRSLNVPFVELLRQYGVPKMHAAARQFGFEFLDRPAAHYGLSLVLGGCEVSMEQMSGWFLGLARQQRYYYERQGQSSRADWRLPTLLFDTGRDPMQQLSREPFLIGPGAGYHLVETMRRLERPDGSGDWQRWMADRPIAWKTGTSFGFRDAWAVGCSPDQVVAVWAGNADGEGRPGLVGVRAAGPLLFDAFRALPRSTPWFEPPYDHMQQVAICRETGFLPGPFCGQVDTVWLCRAADRAPSCPYHQRIFTDRSGRYRTQLDCAAPEDVVPQAVVVLPAREALYARRARAYRELPPWSPACRDWQQQYRGDAGLAQQPMQLIQPNSPGRIRLALDWLGNPIPTVFQVAHRDPEVSIYWHLDENYLGSTDRFHEMAILPEPGTHRLVLVDEHGARFSYLFDVL